MQKRGQVTIFIILGIVVLAVFGLIFFFRGQIIKGDFQSELQSVKVPEQLKPVKSYIDGCIEETVLKGAYTLGSKGGYINIPSEDIPRSAINPFSNSLKLGDSEIAYWYYKSANNLDKSQIPTKEGMAYELEQYINSNLPYCLEGLDLYLNEGFEIEQSDSVYSEVNIQNTHIEVRVISPTDIRLGDVGKYFDQHLVDVQVNLGKLYDLALEVYDKEDKDKFLEEKTIDMMVVYDDIPYSNTDFECKRLVWQKSEVEKNFRNIVERNMGALRLKNSNYVKTNEDNNYFEVDLSTDKDITTSFEYFSGWPFSMEVSPSNGNTLVGDSVTNSNPDISKYLNLFFCMNNYNFVYDVKYPALISLSDETGFTFQFANMVVIDKNTPRKYEGEIVSYDEGGALGEEFCNNKINTLDVGVWDARTYAGISDADISYSCISSSCYVGKTGDDGLLVTKFPACINGQVYADKAGYYSNPEMISTDVDSKVNLLMEPYYNLDVEVKVVELDSGKVRSLESDEEAIFQLENLDNGFVTSVIDESGIIDLVAGTYSVTAYLMKEGDPITIKGETSVNCISVPKGGFLGVIGFNNEECFETKTEDSEIDSFIAGGANFEFSLSYSGLDNNNKLILYVPYEKDPKTQNDMLNIVTNINKNKNNANFIYPKLE